MRIPKAGHYAFIDQPEAFHSICMRALEGSSAAAAAAAIVVRRAAGIPTGPSPLTGEGEAAQANAGQHRSAEEGDSGVAAVEGIGLADAAVGSSAGVGQGEGDSRAGSREVAPKVTREAAAPADVVASAGLTSS